MGMRSNWVPNSQSQGQNQPQSHQTTDVDTLAKGSRYPLHHLHMPRMADGSSERQLNEPMKIKTFYPNHQPSTVKSPALRDVLAESRSPIRKSSSTAPVRRRISRACDQCNQLRTKCDGQTPCAHCIEFALSCEYARERKKRGKASKKDLAQQAAAAAVTSRQQSTLGSPLSPNAPSPVERASPHEPSPEFETSFNNQPRDVTPQTIPSLAGPSDTHHHHHQQQQQEHQQQHQQQLRPGSIGNASMNNFGHTSDMHRHSMQMADLRPVQVVQNSSSGAQAPPSIMGPQPYSGYHDGSFSLMNPQEHSGPPVNGFRYANSNENSSVPYLGVSPPAQSPGWLSLPSPPPTNFPPHFPMPNATNTLRYPVLQPILPHIALIIPQSLACDLLDLYFTSSSSTHMCPQSPYVVGYFFRKQSFLHPTRPRQCSPALLASMLWVAAQTSDAAFLTSPPSARGRVCQKLLELTVGLLKPLIHGPALGEASPNYAANMVINGVALGGFGVSMDQLGSESSATGAIDDVATYIHLATVVSASEYKAASMRWWTAAWSLARELKLGREIPPNIPQNGQNSMATGERDAEGDMDRHGLGQPSNETGNLRATEEEREERRRIWWLLYIMDRHLALCYNRPLSLLDKECEGLLQPMNDMLWQAGDFPNNQYRRVGPSFECTNHSTFGYFLPLMTILGEIVDLNHARSHPRFGLNFRNGNDWDAEVAEITRQLEIYGQSLREFEARYTNNIPLNVETENPQESTLQGVMSPSGRSTSTVGSRMSESIVQTKIVVAYGTHIMHVLHILLTGKWDPIALLDDTDLWISSESFIRAMGHAVSAAEAAADILEYDPDLSFMPYFFGVYLLQGSFLLLLTADKLQGDANPSVVRACETIVRAHEACVVTLNTEYQVSDNLFRRLFQNQTEILTQQQRNFRKVMRSALAQVRGRIPEDFGEQQQRRREVLSLYRWTGDGSGLAL
ncbi:xylanolytic transcriptional activator xlnR [[Emmonsia] crescens]|uniref:Xylanolytic transcriptional activator xlnR n=1 Tax=[Emmonsia] crescens TaxID=73230 RepID=A0A0G2I4V2_9EURO|nr:xylanolytic transcriptional activator xlnR [Emmonsia crescens UAMH 3008]